MTDMNEFQPIAWGKTFRGNLDTRVSSIEAKVGGKIPSELTAFLKQFKGASVTFGIGVEYRPEERTGWVRKGGRLPVDRLFGLGNDDHGISALLKTYAARLPNGVLPFGEGPAGNLLCLVVRPGKRHGHVYFWDHEDEREMTGDERNDFGNMYRAAKTFGAFLKKLHVEKPRQGSYDLDSIDVHVSDELDKKLKEFSRKLAKKGGGQ